MTHTGTQNREYDPTRRLMVRAVFSTPCAIPDDPSPGVETSVLVFDWNSRDEVRNFAAQSDRIIRAGGTTTLSRV